MAPHSSGSFWGAYVGRIGPVAIYTRAISAEEVTASYQASGIARQILRPDADLAATGWNTAPLWSKLNEEIITDGIVITGVAS